MTFEGRTFTIKSLKEEYAFFGDGVLLFCVVLLLSMTTGTPHGGGHTHGRDGPALFLLAERKALSYKGRKKQ